MTLLAANTAALVFGLAAGAVIGAVHFGTLGYAVRLIAAGSPVRAAGVQAGRFGLAGIALFGLAQLGAGPLIAGLGGVLLARHVVLRRFGRAP